MPSPVYLLDTNVVLHLVRGGDAGREIAAVFGLMNSVNRPLVSIVTHGELMLLAARNNWGAAKRTALENALGNLVTVDLNDEAVLSAYVEVQQYSRQYSGKIPGGSRQLNANDAWIVACAKAADATLLTTDRDFSHLKPPDWPVQFFDAAPFSVNH